MEKSGRWRAFHDKDRSFPPCLRTQPLKEATSVDGISLGSTGLTELVQSRYPVLADVEVLVISDGVLPITARTMTNNAGPTQGLDATLNRAL
jgi:hypothetical protein